MLSANLADLAEFKYLASLRKSIYACNDKTIIERKKWYACLIHKRGGLISLRSPLCLKHSRRSGKVLREENDSPIHLASTYIRPLFPLLRPRYRRGKGGSETSCGKYIWLRRGEEDAQRVAGRSGRGREEGGRAGVNIAAAVAAATPHINIPGKSARVKHLFSTRGFSKWRESGCSNSAEATITRLAGRLSICILSTEEFITVRSHSLPRLFLSRLYTLYRTAAPPLPLLLLLSEFSCFSSPPALEDRIACRVSIFSHAFPMRVVISFSIVSQVSA